MIVLIIIYVIGLFFFVLHESKSIYEDLAMDITNVSDDNCIKKDRNKFIILSSILWPLITIAFIIAIIYFIIDNFNND